MVLAGWFLTIFLFISALQAAPVIIEINLEDKSDFEYTRTLNLSPWARWGNVFIAQTEESGLALLEKQGIPFEVLTRFPEVQKNYLLSPHPGVEPSKALKVLLRPVLNRAEQGFAQLDRAGLDLMEEKGYYALEIGEEPIPFTYVSPPQVKMPSTAATDWIQTLVDQISQDSLLAYTQKLQNFQTRYSYSDSIASARQWLLDKFASFGIDSVYLDHYFYDSDQWNVVATVPGTAEPDALIVVGGHYDSVTYGQSPGPLTYAPGADDNGSGTAATLELARIIANNPLPQTVVFVPFAQEEQGIIGSKAYADEAFIRGDDIRCMFNMDMIGYKPNSTSVKVLHDPSSLPVADLMVSLAPTYAGLTAIKGSASSNSDHWYFMQHGYRAVFAHEYIFNNQGWHKNTDLTDSMNFDYMTKVVKLVMATMASLSQNSCQDYAGDVNNDNNSTLADVIYLVNYIFNQPGGPWTINPSCSGDVNGDSSLLLSDVIYLVNFIFGKPGDWTPVPTGSCCVI
jgi:hypothetical protein